MNLMKLLKLSTCIVCLGTVISGLSVKAMEDNHEEINEHIEQNQATNDNDLEESQNIRMREICSQEKVSGKSETYAKFYAKLTVFYDLETEETRRNARREPGFLLSKK